MPIALITTAPTSTAGLPPAGPDAARGGDGGFAELLNRQSAADENSAPADEAAEAPESGAARETRETRGERTRPANRPAQPRPATRPATATAVDTADGTAGPEAAAKPDDADTAPLVDPALVNWLAAMQRPTLPAGPGTGHTTGGTDVPSTGKDGAATPLALDATPGAALPNSPDSTDRPDLRPAAGRDGRGATDLRALAEEAERRVGAVDREEPPRAAAEQRVAAAPAAGARPSGFEAAAAALAAAPAPATTATANPAAVAVTLPLAPDSPEFGRAFGVQVSVLARDGVQQAELHLNPAETGPVSVQIVLEGTQARIEFGADAAPTRQAIEQSLPELAAALREAGLTLSGGGVSEHSRGRDSAPADPADGRHGLARRDGPARDEAPAVPRPWRSSRSAGGVDLYA